MRKRKILNKFTRQKTVIFCIPGKVFSDKFLQSFSSLLGWCYSNNIQPILSNGYNPVVYYARNECLGGNTLKGVNQKPFQGKIKYDYIMWIDSDMVFEPEEFKALLDMNRDVASGIYKTKNGNNYATVLKMEKEFYKENGHYEFLNDNTLKILPDEFRVDYTGFGWILFKKGVLEKIEYPWFKPYWYNYGKNIKEFTSEDVGICRSLREVGVNIIVNKNLVIGHEKSCVLR